MVLWQGGERGPHELGGRRPPCGEQPSRGRGSAAVRSVEALGETEQVCGQHQRGAAPGAMGSRPAALPPHHPSSPGAAAASEPSVSSISGFPMASSCHIGKRSNAFLVRKEDLLQKHLEMGCWSNSSS